MTERESSRLNDTSDANAAETEHSSSPKAQTANPAASAAAAMIVGAADAASAALGLLGWRVGEGNSGGDSEVPPTHAQPEPSVQGAPSVELKQDQTPKPTSAESEDTKPESLPPETKPITPSTREQPVSRAPGLPGAMVERLLDATVNQIGSYVETSSAVEALIRTQTARILDQLVNDPHLEELIRAQAGKYLDELAAQPERLDGLVRSAADRYIANLLTDSTKLDPLVRQLGDRYIEYLHEHPESVQDLIQGQSLSLAGEIIEEIRHAAVAADTLAEMIARRILRRTPRAELPPPPPEIIALAEIKRPLAALRRGQADEKVK